MVNKKNIIITGASQGLGKSIAKILYHEMDCNLFLIARSNEKLENIRKELYQNKKDNKIITIVSDLSKLNSVNNITNTINKYCSGIDILINNAATHGPIGMAWDNDWTEWLKTIQVNLYAPIQLCNAFIPYMIKQNKGKIINISGGGATAGRENFTAYATSKVGLVRFSETLSKEVEKYNIDVNCIAPGIMNSSLLREVLTAGKDSAGEKEYNIAFQQQNKVGDATQKAAELCLYLVSNKSDGITGKLISAVWDPWETLEDHIEDLKKSDIYTLRRIIPSERNMDWGER